jgi:hypothetical protein
MGFAGVHIVFMAELLVAADDRRILRTNNALESLHKLAKDCNARLWRQDKWCRSVLSVGSDRRTESHRANAFDGDVVALLHTVGSVSLEANGYVRY